MWIGEAESIDALFIMYELPSALAPGNFSARQSAPAKFQLHCSGAVSGPQSGEYRTWQVGALSPDKGAVCLVSTLRQILAELG